MKHIRPVRGPGSRANTPAPGPPKAEAAFFRLCLGGVILASSRSTECSQFVSGPYTSLFVNHLLAGYGVGRPGARTRNDRNRLVAAVAGFHLG
jgi:hypothetical protein